MEDLAVGADSADANPEMTSLAMASERCAVQLFLVNIEP